MLSLDTNVMNLIQVGFDCLSDLDTLLMLRMDTNVMNSIQVGFDCLSNLDTNVKDTNVMIDYAFDIGWNFEKDGYKCYNGLSF